MKVLRRKGVRRHLSEDGENIAKGKRYTVLGHKPARCLVSKGIKIVIYTAKLMNDTPYTINVSPAKTRGGQRVIVSRSKPVTKTFMDDLLSVNMADTPEGRKTLEAIERLD